MLNRRLHRLVCVYTCQTATFLEMTCHGSYYSEIKGDSDAVFSTIVINIHVVQYHFGTPCIWLFTVDKQYALYAPYAPRIAFCVGSIL